MPRITKLQAMRVHAKRRARMRYGLELNSKDRRYIRQVMKQQLAVRLETISNRVAVYLVELCEGDRLPIIWDHNRNAIVTVLPISAVEILKYRSIVSQSICSLCKQSIRPREGKWYKGKRYHRECLPGPSTTIQEDFAFLHKQLTS